MYTNLQARKAYAVTPSDTVNLDYGIRKACAGVYVGSTGDLAVIMVGADDDSDVTTFSNVADGTFLPIQVKRVNSTGTTASDILALY